MNLIQRIEWYLMKKIKYFRLKNKQPTIISSNCIGTFIYYDMKLRFQSPTINLSFDMNDYIKFLENLKWYLEQPVIEYKDDRFDFPCGLIGDIEIRFNHYKSFEEAKNKWNERKKRINWDNLFIIGIDGDNCTYESIQRFDALPFDNKVILTHIPYTEIVSSYYLPGFESFDGIKVATNFKNQFLIRRYIDDFDYVSFLNKKIYDRKGVHHYE